MFEALKIQEIEKKYINILKNIYKQQSTNKIRKERIDIYYRKRSETERPNIPILSRNYPRSYISFSEVVKL